MSVTDKKAGLSEPLQWSDVSMGEPDPNAERILIIPDLHNRTDRADYWLAQQFDSAVFLGDYFDAHDDTPEDARRVALWLRDHLTDTRLMFLIGNHDAHYIYPDYGTIAYPGFTREKAEAINEVLQLKDWNRMRLACMAGSFLVSHAGFSPIWVRPPTLQKILHRCRTAEQRMAKGLFDPVFGNGELPGGAQKYGGPLAMDWGFFVPIQGISQIVGHTSGSDVRVKPEKSINLCLDVGNAEMAAVIQGDHVTILRMSQTAVQAHERLTP